MSRAPTSRLSTHARTGACALLAFVQAQASLAAPVNASGSNCLALLGGRLDARWGIPLAVVAGALVAWGLVVVIRRLLR
jgi:hypothetical protein